MLILIALVVWMIKNLERSNTGREMLAVRNAPAAAASVGVSPTATKLKVFALSAGVAGLGGVLLATNDLSLTSNSVPPITGLLWLAGVVLLGVRRPAGAIVAGLFIGVCPGASDRLHAAVRSRALVRDACRRGSDDPVRPRCDRARRDNPMASSRILPAGRTNGANVVDVARLGESVPSAVADANPTGGSLTPLPSGTGERP